MRPTRRSRERGSTLALAMVLLAVLTVVGVAAVSVASQERANAGLKTARDRLVACAAAAQAAIWSELLAYGPTLIPSSGASIPEITLPDGTRLRAGHYHDPAVVVVDTSLRTVPCRDPKVEDYLDLTNRDSAFGRSGTCFSIVARCVDSQDRELEVEFALNTLF